MRVPRALVMFAASGLLAVTAQSANAQILDRILGERPQREREVERQIDRSYRAAPTQRSDSIRYSEPRYTEEGQIERREYRSSTSSHFRAPSDVRTTSRLIGSNVRLADNVTLGRVEDVVFSEAGCIEFMVVSVTGLRGVSDRWAAVPWNVGHFELDQRMVYIDLDERELRRAPVFFRTASWPDFYDNEWTSDVYAFFGVEAVGFERGRAYGEAGRRDRDRDDRGRDRDDRFDDRGRDRDDRDRDEGTEDRRSRDRSESFDDRNRSDSRRDSSRDLRDNRTSTQERDNDATRSTRDRTDSSTRSSSSTESGSDQSKDKNIDTTNEANESKDQSNRKDSPGLPD